MKEGCGFLSFIVYKFSYNKDYNNYRVLGIIFGVLYVLYYIIFIIIM